MNNRIEELNSRMDLCPHGLKESDCYYCERAFSGGREDYEGRHRFLIRGAIAFALVNFLIFAVASCRGAEIYDIVNHSRALTPMSEQTAMIRSAPGSISERFLDALSQVESGNRNVPGDGGRALGVFQFHRDAWRDVSALRLMRGTNYYRYDQAVNYAVAREYAREYCGWLQAQLTVALGRLPTNGEIYAAYNRGLSRFAGDGYKLSRCPRSTQQNAKIIEGMTK